MRNTGMTQFGSWPHSSNPTKLYLDSLCALYTCNFNKIPRAEIKSVQADVQPAPGELHQVI